MPWNEFGPANVPLAAQCTATWSPSATMSCDLEAQVGHRAEELRPVGADAVGPVGLVAERRVMTPSGAQAAAIASRSCFASASK